MFKFPDISLVRWSCIQMEAQSLSQQQTGWRGSLVFMIIMCLKCLLSSHLQHASGEKKKKKSHFYLLPVFPLLPVSTHLFSLCDIYRYICVCMEIYITYILYAEICFYSLYNMCSHIIYTICKRKFCPSVISRLEICGNEFACVCLLPLPLAQGMATTRSGSHASQKRSRMHQALVHVAKDDWRLIIPHWIFCFSSCFSALFPLLWYAFPSMEPDGQRRAFPYLFSWSPLESVQPSAATAVGSPGDL